MSQFDFGTIDPDTKTGTALAGDLNDWRDALNTLHAGPTRPAYAQTGMLWMKEISGTFWQLTLYDGTDDIVIATIDPSTGVFSLPTSSIADQAITFAKLAASSIASQAEAEAGAAADKLMTPQRVAQTLAALGGGLQSMQVFTSSAVWSRPAGITRVLAFVTGGGGGSGGAQGGDAAGLRATGGGGAGATAIDLIDVSEVPSVSATIGAGGGGGGVGGGPGGNGGATSFGSFMTAGGGFGSAGTGTPAGDSYRNDGAAGGGISVFGSINMVGGRGGPPYGLTAGGAIVEMTGGRGGDSWWGAGGRNTLLSLPAGGGFAGVAGTAFGAGGSGAVMHDTTSLGAGGFGAAGICWVLEFK